MEPYVVTTSAFVAAGIGMGLGAIGSAIGEGHAAGGTLEGVARQPACRDTLVRDMLLGQAIAETPGIFALVVSILLIFSVEPTDSLVHAAALLGAGISIGLGALGPAVGGGVIAARAVRAISRNPTQAGPAMRTMILGQALCQTTVVYSLLIALILWVFGPSFAIPGQLVREIPRAAALLGAGLCMGFGAIGAAIGTGEVGGVAAEAVAVYPESESPITRAFFVGAAVSQTTSIYALVVAILLVFVVSG